MATTRCQQCHEPLPPSYRCLVCEYEDKTGHQLERIPERPVLEDFELMRLFELEPTRPMSKRERYELARGNGLTA
jgi:hypothetical protein